LDSPFSEHFSEFAFRSAWHHKLENIKQCVFMFCGVFHEIT